MLKKAKTVYQITPDGVYIGQIILSETSGDISPLDGEWLIPNGCIEIEPPPIPEGKRLFWRDNTWVLENAPLDLESEPELEPTLEERLERLDAEYDSQFDALTLAWATAYMSGDIKTTEARLADKQFLQQEYEEKKEAILNG